MLDFQTTTAQPIATSGSSDWNDFLNTVIRGTTDIITVVRAPAGTVQGGYQNTRVASPGTAGDGSSMLGIVVLVLVIFLVTSNN